MALLAGQWLGPYEIVGPLGAGGMGEVYRARDTRLNREVALKILPDALGVDPDRLARLRREAQLLASLNHPNIAQVYGLEESAGSPAVVMELVDGPTLAELLQRGHPLPFDEALAVARQIADALESAHEAGVVHRDLKPANIKVRRDDAVKVLDFGLAKALEGDVHGTADAALSPAIATVTSPALTAMGVILGTAAYMAPEQARGKPTDKRVDVWAFGCVLWEMLTGRCLFGRETLSDTLAAVIKDAPPLDYLPAAIPAPVRRLIERCLERDPRMRLRDMGEARILLSRLPDEAPPAAGTRIGARAALVGATAAVALAAITGLVVWRAAPHAVVPVRRLELGTPLAGAAGLALSRDGTRIAYETGGHLYVRPLASLDARDLGRLPVASENLFWSPDGATIGFVAARSVQTVPATGGTIFTVCRVPASGRVMDVRWLDDGTIAFAVWRDSIYKVSAAGGTPTLLLPIDPARDVDFHALSPLPGGRLLVLAHEKESDSDVIDSFDGRTRTRFSSERVSQIEYIRPGFLLLLRRGTNAGLWAVPFTGNGLDMTKESLIQAGASDFNVAEDGTILFELPASRQVSLAWVDRGRVVTRVPGPPIAGFEDLALSPDGTRAAYVAGAGPAANLIIRDLRSGEETPLTFNKPEAATAEWPSITNPAWFPQGDRIVYSTGPVTAMSVVAQGTDAAQQPRTLTAGLDAKVSADGRMLLFKVDDRGRYLLRKAPILADGTLGPATPVFRDNPEPIVRDFDLSPDGRLLAYATPQADGSAAVFLTDVPATANRWLVAAGGRHPHFSRDGREIVVTVGHVDEQGRPIGELRSTGISYGPPVRLGPSERLFDDASDTAPLLDKLSVSPDGRHFLMAVPAQGNGPRVVILQNWPALLGR